MADAAHESSLSIPLFEKQRRAFMWRKLFSLSGVLPVGGFVAFHLWENATALQGREHFVETVNKIGSMPYLTFLEVGVILLPILFHAILGIKIALDASYNVGAYPYSRNWMFVLQRLAGVLTLGFVIYHLWELRIQKLLYGMDGAGFYDTLCQNMSSTAAGVPIIALIYIIGIAAVAFHFANGLFGFLFSWGITVSRRSQRLSATLLGVLGLLIFVLGANTAVYFATGSRLFIPSEFFSSHHDSKSLHCDGAVLQPPVAPMPATSAKP